MSTITKEKLKESIMILRAERNVMYKEIAAKSEAEILLLRTLYDERYHLKEGDIVSQNGKPYKVKDVIVRVDDDPDGKPGVCGYVQRATGVFGTSVRNLYNDWEIVSQA
jgi:hypothetical protein